MMSFDLTGRVVLVTGAGGRLGREMSHGILRAGAELVMVGRKEESLLAAQDLFPQKLRGRCHALTSDVTQANSPELLRAEINKRFGRLHGIVNNAYAGKVGTLDSIEAGDFLSACTYNLVAPFALVKAFAPLMEATAKRERVTASVVNVASMYGCVSPDPSIYGNSNKNNPVHYGVSKAGMIQLSRYLACHLGPVGIRVNSISPGPFPDTEADPGIPQFHEKLARKVPMGRVGKVEEISGPVVFLLSEAAAYVNGANLPVDGGWTAW